jgi:hypothetical protein
MPMQGYDLNYIRDWRKLQFEHGKPSSLNDFRQAHDLPFPPNTRWRTTPLARLLAKIRAIFAARLNSDY